MGKSRPITSAFPPSGSLRPGSDGQLDVAFSHAGAAQALQQLADQVRLIDACQAQSSGEIAGSLSVGTHHLCRRCRSNEHLQRATSVDIPAGIAIMMSQPLRILDAGGLQGGSQVGMQPTPAALR